MTAPIRARFAPSPTGYLHLGSARTALFNWMFIRHLQERGEDAQFLIRVEDTDLDRSQPELTDGILEALDWLGLTADGETVFQSQRRDEHVAAVAQLIAEGHAYRCDCSQEEARSRAEAAGSAGYDGHCRDRGVGADTTHVVRFRTPDSGMVEFDDVVRGAMSFDNGALEDFVVQRSDGSPVFVVANAVDDAAMGITHVIRGEDLLNVTPKMLLVRRALGHSEDPTFAHLPLIVNAQRKKLSKRRDDVSVADYRERGFLPEAMVNYLALLGWGPPDEVEVRPIEEMVPLFELDRVGDSAALFDTKKLESVNGDHIRMLSTSDFLDRSRPWLDAEPWADRIDEDQLAAIAPDIQLRARLLSDVPGLVDFLFLADPPEDPASWAKAVEGNDSAVALIDGALAAFDALGPREWTSEGLHAATLAVGESQGLKLGKAQAPIRVAVTGRSVGPPLFESLEVLGRDETIRRLGAARARL